MSLCSQAQTPTQMPQSACNRISPQTPRLTPRLAQTRPLLSAPACRPRQRAKRARGVRPRPARERRLTSPQFQAQTHGLVQAARLPLSSPALPRPAHLLRWARGASLPAKPPLPPPFSPAPTRHRPRARRPPPPPSPAPAPPRAQTRRSPVTPQPSPAPAPVRPARPARSAGRQPEPRRLPRLRRLR